MKRIPFPKGMQSSRYMKKAFQRNSQQDENLSVLVLQLDREKRLAFNCLSKKKEAYAWETIKRTSLPVMGKTHHIEEISETVSGKLAFVQQKYGKRPVIRWSGKDVKRDNKVKVSKHIMNCESDKPVHERSELSLQQFTEISRLDNKDLYTVHADKK